MDNNKELSLDNIQKQYLFAKDMLHQFQHATKDQYTLFLKIPSLPYNLSILQEFVQFCEDSGIHQTIKKAD